MKWLKGILIALVVLLVVILVTGGVLIGFNHNGHDTQQVASQDQNQQAIQNGLPAENNQGGTAADTGHPVEDSNSTQGNTHANQAQGPQQQVAVVVPDTSVAPEEYLKRIEESAQLIKEATALIANDAYLGTSPTPGDLNNQNATDQQQQNVSPGGMAKMHQGIYKMAQALTIMDQTVKEMNKEIKNAREKGISYYEVLPKTQYLPNNTYPYWNYPQQYQQPNYAPYYYQQPQSNPQMNHNQPDPQQHNTQTPDQGHAANATSHGATGGLSNIFNIQSLVLIIYGILFMSFIAAIIGIGGYISSLFKPAEPKQQSGESVV